MGFKLSKESNPLVSENFDGQSSDYNLTAQDYYHPFGPEWFLGYQEIGLIKEEFRNFKTVPDDLPVFSLNH